LCLAKFKLIKTLKAVETMMKEEEGGGYTSGLKKGEDSRRV
jgi:hypothetical protein